MACPLNNNLIDHTANSLHFEVALPLSYTEHGKQDHGLVWRIDNTINDTCWLAESSTRGPSVCPPAGTTGQGKTELLAR
jgi:hypothetical protein